MTMPTARSTMLPLRANSLNSLSMLSFLLSLAGYRPRDRRAGMPEPPFTPRRTTRASGDLVRLRSDASYKKNSRKQQRFTASLPCFSKSATGGVCPVADGSARVHANGTGNGASANRRTLVRAPSGPAGSADWDSLAAATSKRCCTRSRTAICAPTHAGASRPHGAGPAIRAPASRRRCAKCKGRWRASPSRRRCGRRRRATICRSAIDEIRARTAPPSGDPTGAPLPSACRRHAMRRGTSRLRPCRIRVPPAPTAVASGRVFPVLARRMSTGRCGANRWPRPIPTGTRSPWGGGAARGRAALNGAIGHSRPHQADQPPSTA